MTHNMVVENGKFKLHLRKFVEVGALEARLQPFGISETNFPDRSSFSAGPNFARVADSSPVSGIVSDNKKL